MKGMTDQMNQSHEIDVLDDASMRERKSSPREPVTPCPLSLSPSLSFSLHPSRKSGRKKRDLSRWSKADKKKITAHAPA